MKIKRNLKKMLWITFSIVAFLLIIAILGLNHYAPLGDKPQGTRLENMQHSPNYTNGIFDNLNPIKKDYGWEFMKEFFTKQLKNSSDRKPSKPLPIVKWTRKSLQSISDTATFAIWYGHSAFYLKLNGKNILLDPMLGKYASPLPIKKSKRFNDSLPLQIQDLPSIDIIILSHDHYDHLDYTSISALKSKTQHFLVPLGVGAHLERWGVAPEKITELDWYNETEIDGITYACTPSQHFSGRSFNDKFRTLWCSWVISGKHKIFFSGDSGYFNEFKKIGDKYGPFDVCLMECGQYDELWYDIHMFPAETVQAHIDLQGDMLIPIHWGGFSLATHNWNDPIIQLTAICSEKNINLATPKIGEKILFGEKQQFSKWWINVNE